MVWALNIKKEKEQKEVETIPVHTVTFKDSNDEVISSKDYAFDGWYKEKAFLENSRNTQEEQEEIEKETLYGKTQEISVIMPRAEKEGYTLDSWYEEEIEAGTKYKASDKYTAMLQNDKEFKATWKANQYTIEYNGNSSTSGEMRDTVAIYDTEKELRKNEYEKEGYDFTGWNTQADGTGISFEDGEKVKNLVSKGKVTLYAQYTETKYTVTFEYNGGNVNRR